MHSISRRHLVCRAARIVRNDPAMASGLVAIALALSVLFGIAASYANRTEPAVDLGLMMSNRTTQHLPLDW
jgi:hypothetical protein